MSTIDREETFHSQTFQGWPPFVIQRVKLQLVAQPEFYVLRLNGSAYEHALTAASWRDAVDAAFAMTEVGA